MAAIRHPGGGARFANDISAETGLLAPNAAIAAARAGKTG